MCRSTKSEFKQMHRRLLQLFEDKIMFKHVCEHDIVPQKDDELYFHQ